VSLCRAGSCSSDPRDEKFASFGFNVFGESAQTICVFDFRELTRSNILDTCADAHADGVELVRAKIGKDILRGGIGNAERASVLFFRRGASRTTSLALLYWPVRTFLRTKPARRSVTETFIWPMLAPRSSLTKISPRGTNDNL
jgi:hypothetical protein